MRFVEVRPPIRLMCGRYIGSETVWWHNDRALSARCERSILNMELHFIMGQASSRLEDLDNDLSPSMRRLLASLFEDIRYLEGRIAEASRQIEAVADARTPHPD
jgi:hypothetical protein